MEWHHTAQSEATQHLKTLCEALWQSHNMDFNPNTSEDRKPSPEAKDAVHNLKVINDSIACQNKEHKLDTDLGKIRYHDLIGKWRPIFINPQLANTLMPGLITFCNSYHYPKEWAMLPGEAAQGGTSNQNPQDAHGQIPTNTINAHFHTEGVRGAPNKNPQDTNGQTPANAINADKHTEGARGVIALALRMTKQTIKQGYTSTGEKILFIQRLGENHACFVVETPDGRQQLVESAAAGGQPALEGVKKAGVPETVQDETTILKFQQQVRSSSGTYGLTFVAVGGWNITNKRLPFIVVGFYHTNNNGTEEAAVSQSNLGKILAPHEAECLIVEGIVSYPDLSLREALESQISPTHQQYENEQPQFMGQPRPLSWEKQEPAWFQKPRSQFEPSYGKQQPPYFQQHPYFQQPPYFQQQQHPYFQQPLYFQQQQQQQPYFSQKPNLEPYFGFPSMTLVDVHMNSDGEL